MYHCGSVLSPACTVYCIYPRGGGTNDLLRLLHVTINSRGNNLRGTYRFLAIVFFEPNIRIPPWLYPVNVLYCSSLRFLSLGFSSSCVAGRACLSQLSGKEPIKDDSKILWVSSYRFPEIMKKDSYYQAESFNKNQF